MYLSLREKAREAEEKPGESSLSGMLERERERKRELTQFTLPRSMPRDSHIFDVVACAVTLSDS